ncbi:hypothetical protein RI103_12870 [Paraburkholderia sp. FT54]|jgi:hypothetical protein|uniref:hypothetical protein n=1 Tax=Paraburkholderia sp. FT54 TaxID=3074437 RepID=UPI002877B572|nr:hypothetical protein [Paraburkholderia sp. FT54]WNC88606.1 hypothetical protein RI103_12870 [Paraburkholderia sp. FT54]
MNDVNTMMSPNLGGAGMAGGGSTVGAGGGLSSQKVAEVLAKILEKQNKDFDNKLQQAEGTDDKQQNTAMMQVQQAMGSVNTTQSVATACVQGLTDAQKETARASH